MSFDSSERECKKFKKFSRICNNDITCCIVAGHVIVIYAFPVCWPKTNFLTTEIMNIVNFSNSFT